MSLYRRQRGEHNPKLLPNNIESESSPVKRKSARGIRESVQVFLGMALLCAPLFAAQGDPADAVVFPSSDVSPPPSWRGPLFHLSQNYPRAKPRRSRVPTSIDFRCRPYDYLMALRQYCYQGNIEAGWKGNKNLVRRWYHAPFLDYGPHGREPIEGLTYERVSPAHTLALTQETPVQNWAVSMYNGAGGYTIGKVWANGTPNMAAARFLPGTVAVKLLFTEATPDQVPFLAGSVKWPAYIYEAPLPSSTTAPTPKRCLKRLRLLQMDIAVRDPRANGTTGWVFGTFCYSRLAKGASPWERMMPVGLMWGNDPSFQAGQKLHQTWINPDPILKAQLLHLGWQDRLNGPVDNPISSCISCHSNGEVPPGKSGMTPSGQIGSTEWMRWFHNIPAATAFDAGSQSCDYSLQLMTGAVNWQLKNQKAAPSQAAKGIAGLPTSTR